jgi:O-succinylbenzoic acid--CoA ligase
MLFHGYAGDPELTASTLRDGWLQTADLGRFDSEGRLEVVGRADDVVQSGGVNISLTAVERRIAGMETVEQCVVLAEADPEWGARLVAYVVPRHHDEAPDLASMRDRVAEVLPRSWAPQEMVIVQRLPMLESGKIDRRSLRLRRRNVIGFVG